MGGFCVCINRTTYVVRGLGTSHIAKKGFLARCEVNAAPPAWKRVYSVAIDFQNYKKCLLNIVKQCLV